jgi:iron complex outermembrane receptor protein
MKQSKLAKTCLAACISATFSLVAFSPVAFAQDEEVQKPSGVLEEVYVTARKREESIQTVPIAVTAISGEQIERSFKVKVEGIDEMAPNVELGRMQFGGGGLTGSIRGISFAETERTFEPAVGLMVDGVNYGTGTGAMVDLFDIESIEILRGPQGTLFGRNTMGGTINIRRTRPTTDELHGKVSVGYGSYSSLELKGLVNIPLGDTFALKLSAIDLSSDLYTKNVITGKREDGIDQTTLGLKLRWTPSDNVDIMFSWDNVNDDSAYPTVLNISEEGDTFCDLGNIGVFPKPPAYMCLGDTAEFVESFGRNFDDYNTDVTGTPFAATIDSDVMALEIDWDINDSLAFNSITGYHDVEDRLLGEVTGIPDWQVAPGVWVPFFVVDRQQTYEQFSQEFRLVSNNDGNFNYVAGLYYFGSEYGLEPQTVINLGSLVQTLTSTQKLDAYAAYAEIYWQLSDKNRLTIGGRYTKEEKDFTRTGQNADGTYFLSCPDPTSLAEGCRTGTEDWSNFSPRLIFDRQFTDDIFGYISYSGGFRSGGWSGRGSTDFNIGPYDPEELDNFEIGMRSEFMDGRVRFNATAFYMDYQDKQEDITVSFTAPDGTVTTDSFVENAASATTKGLEFELYWQATDYVTIRSALGLLDGEYDSYDTIVDGEKVSLLDVRHYRYAPDMTFNLGGDWAIPMGSGEIVLTANYKFTDEFWVTPEFDYTGNNRDLIESHSTFDLSAIWIIGNFSISVYGNDIFHSDNRLLRKFDAGAFWFADIEPHRTYGARVQYNF